MNHYAHSTDIVGYTYRAELLCPACTIRALPTGEGEQFDGWKDVSTPPMSAEENLTELAAAFGIDRFDEATYDSDEFPKVAFRDMVDGDTCGNCGEDL